MPELAQVDTLVVTALTDDEQIVQDVPEEIISGTAWFEKYPEYAVTLLVDEEVDALVGVAKKAFPQANAADYLEFDKSFDVASFAGCTLGIRIAGYINIKTFAFSLQSYVFVKILFQTFKVKGPKLEGSITEGLHIGPINILLPNVGTIDITAKIKDGYVVVIIKMASIVFAPARSWFAPFLQRWVAPLSLLPAAIALPSLQSLLELLPPIVLAVPKKKVSHSRKAMREANKGLKDKLNIVNCPACGMPKLAHNLCTQCYRGLTAGWKEEAREASAGHSHSHSRRA